MKLIIIDYIERSIFYRFFLGILIESIFLNLIFLVIPIEIIFFFKFILFAISSFIFASFYLVEYKHYTYRIELDGKFLKLKTHLWRKKKDIELDLNNVTIYYSNYSIVKSVKTMILFYDGVNTPLYKTKKILHRINPESSIFYRDWTQEKVNSLYDTLIEIQKEVIVEKKEEVK